jgi:hypothetical protein
MMDFWNDDIVFVIYKKWKMWIKKNVIVVLKIK